MSPGLLIFSYFFVILDAFSLNVESNACPHLELYPVSAFSDQCYVNPDVLSNVPQMVIRHGYNITVYNVTTVDGYILTLFKISLKGKTTKQFPVFIQHGICTNSDPWVDIGNRSIAFDAVNKGYEVWLGNIRGSTYSNKHVTLTVNDPNYWNFTLDTIAGKDMRTQLNFVFKQTGKKIHYLGHSMGTTVCLMFTSEFSRDANQWLQSISLLAPVAYLNNIPATELTRIPANILLDAWNLIHVRGLFYQETAIHNFFFRMCKLLPFVCYGLINVLFGKTEQFKSDDLLLYFSYWPSGASIYQFKQYLQIGSSGKFQKYDYGEEDNIKTYETATPPAYNLSKVTLPICLFYGENDILYNKMNLEKLFNELGSTKKIKYSISAPDGSKKFNHIDFMYSEYIVEYLYEKIFACFNNFE